MSEHVRALGSFQFGTLQPQASTTSVPQEPQASTSGLQGQTQKKTRVTYSDIENSVFAQAIEQVPKDRFNKALVKEIWGDVMNDLFMPDLKLIIEWRNMNVDQFYDKLKLINRKKID